MKRATEDRQRMLSIRHKRDLIFGRTDSDDLRNEMGRFRKSVRVGGCTKSRCLLCHYSKIMGYPGYREAAANDGYREDLRELGLNGLYRRQRVRTR